ncbi:hypothetical protein ACFX2J_033000 [Malus domestica]
MFDGFVHLHRGSWISSTYSNPLPLQESTFLAGKLYKDVMRGRGVKAWIEVVVAGGVETSSGRDMFEEPLPSIECLEISGKAFPGQELVVCRYGVNGTTVCFFDLGCYVDDGSVSYIDGAKSPNYIVSAADVDTYLGVEVQPMDDRDRREKVVTAALANDYKVTYEKKGKTRLSFSLFFFLLK